MKTTLSLLLALAGSAFATTTWFYGASNNSANYGVTPDSSQAVTWADSFAIADASANFSFNGQSTVTLQRPDSLGLDQAIMMYSFGGTGLSAANVTSALLYLRQSNSSPLGIPNTWNIVGISAGNTGWENGAMTWNDINGAAAGDWTGGTLGGSISGSYGTFDDLGTNVAGNLSINITSAFQAYLNGSISGIAFINSNPGDTFSAADYSFVANSDENATATNRPGLFVTSIPEPSAAILGALGVLALLRRRR